MESEEYELDQQMKRLARAHFPQMLSRLPSVKIRMIPFDDAENHGPAWLEVLAGVPEAQRKGTIYIDSRVSNFIHKTTKILLLHELTHYQRYLKTGEAEDIEDQYFNQEIQRLWRERAYNGLL